LILIQNSEIDLHIRTVEAVGYSFIQQAAVRVGSDTLEIDMSMGDPPKFRLNGGSATNSPPSNVGGAPFNSPSSQTYELLLDNGAWIRFNTYFSLSITAHGTAPGFSDSEVRLSFMLFPPVAELGVVASICSQFSSNF
jgi:hypothetical protein